MKKINIGDKVAVLDDDISGIVKNIKNNQVEIETADGFTMTYENHELIVMNHTENYVNNQNFNYNQVLKEKETPLKPYTVKDKKVKNERGVPEFDLHIEQLVPNKKGMSNYDILTLQTETAKRHIEFAIKNRIPKIVFIHGVGEGILKAELDFLLGRYDQIMFQDANYQKYGLGATEVYFKQNS
ncbi:Smr/MutS family protein [Flavobacterium branchiophilum]|uniref:DNA mismatch repair protein MutS n=1 Tax=Flavobacterium branchiophilum TaxID=55197 RepID=A0A2H3KBR9_9FLAO|nr:Smr/MutS family protein [Flavobacterium branchiophilum]PDS24594.1 DNA mismatch repair protein MutS [Flavobacterium branchiophilum]